MGAVASQGRFQHGAVEPSSCPDKVAFEECFYACLRTMCLCQKFSALYILISTPTGPVSREQPGFVGTELWPQHLHGVASDIERSRRTVTAEHVSHKHVSKFVHGHRVWASGLERFEHEFAFLWVKFLSNRWALLIPSLERSRFTGPLWTLSGQARRSPQKIC